MSSNAEGTGKEALLRERTARIAAAVALKRPDRTPVVLGIVAFAARMVGMTFADFLADTDNATRATLEAFELLGADSVDHPTFCASSLSYLWLSRVKIPGIHLPADKPWQVEENELMTVSDYDVVISNGWPAFLDNFMRERINEGVAEKFAKMLADVPRHLQTWRRHGALPTNYAVITTPFEMFCGGRSLTRFIRDLYQIPDKVQAAMDAVMPYISGPVLEMGKQIGGYGVWVGGWRSASSMLSRRLWDRFVYPYYEKLVWEVADAGIVPVLHLDSDWTRDLERFRSLPKAKCILATDGDTDLFRAKELLGDHMCLMGDVPPGMLTVGTPDEVYNYSRRLIEELGPAGFILHSGCDVPANAKVENVQAMVAAATGK